MYVQVFRHRVQFTAGERVGPLVYKAFAVVLLHYAVKGHFGFSSKP